jgi:single-stranded-DNA-specific exonuclease
MRNNCGLRAIIDVAGISEEVTAYHLGFIIGPRINAGGRIGESSLGADILTIQDELIVKELALKLHRLNDERQAMERKILEEAVTKIEELKLHEKPIILVGSESWHPGLIGIVASRLREKYGRPCFVNSVNGDTARGSARSVEGVDVGELILNAIKEGLLIGGGGHNMAGGFSMSVGKKDEFCDFLVKNTQKFMATFQPSIRIDAEISIPGANLELVNQLAKIEPIGVGNPAPRFCFHHVRAMFVKPVGNGHLQCRFTDEAGHTLNAIAFRCADTPIWHGLTTRKSISVVGTLRKNEWRGGNSISLVIDDVGASTFSN